MALAVKALEDQFASVDFGHRQILADLKDRKRTRFFSRTSFSPKGDLSAHVGNMI